MRRLTRVAGLGMAAASLVAGCGGDVAGDPYTSLVARPDSYSVQQGQDVDVGPSTGVLANDSAPRGRALTAALIEPPSDGVLSLQASGAFTYTPQAGFAGAMTFTYAASDGVETSAPTLVTLTFVAAAGAPVTQPDAYTTVEETAITVAAAQGPLANDTDDGQLPLVASVVEQPANGTLLMAPTGRFTYTPRADFFGTDSFVYAADDGMFTSQGTVTLTVTGTPDPPRATPDMVSGPEDTVITFPGTFDLTANDVEPDGEPLSVVVDVAPQHGTLESVGDGSLRYTPHADYVGTDSFRYHVSDGVSSSALATATLTLTPVNDAPIARPSSVQVVRDRTRAALLDTFDVDGDALTHTLVASPLHGTVVIYAAAGAFEYTPSSAYVGPDSFTFTVSDGALTSEIATVTLDVVAPPPPAITRLFPAQGTTGRPLQIFGANFLGAQGSVTVGGRAASVLFWSDDYVVAETALDYAPGLHDVVVSTSGAVAGAPVPYEVVPWIDGASATNRTAGSTLELDGDGFGANQGVVTFGSTNASVVAWTNRKVTVTTPSVTGEQAVRLTTAGGVASNVWRLPVTPGAWIAPALPEASEDDLAVWTGTEMLLLYSTDTRGVRYDPLRDRWRPMAKAPALMQDGQALWMGGELLWWGVSGGLRYDPTTDAWSSVSAVDAPLDRWSFSFAWVGDRAAVWGGEDGGDWVNTGALYDPESDTWSAMSLEGAPAAREYPSSVWTGSQLVVLGGTTAGGRYDPATDRWRPVSTLNAPNVVLPVIDWTGTHVVVHGGGRSATALAVGARYHPITDVWTPMISPPSRNDHVGAWTGAELVIRGGCADSSFGCSHTRNGSRWSPTTNAWSAISTTDQPSSGVGSSGVWTGKELVVWGGDATVLSTTNDGARYNPRTDTWAGMGVRQAQSPRRLHTSVWAAPELIVWGGGDDNESFPDGSNTGARYDTTNGTWTALPTSGAPSPRQRQLGVWTGTQLVIWGGSTGSTLHQTGGRYTRSTDTWEATSTTNAPEGRRSATAVWTGGQMVVWGGVNTASSTGGTRLQTGGRYDPAGDAWTSTSTSSAPTGRIDHTAVWTGSRMIVWGGNDTAVTATGGRYDPTTDTWSPMSTTGAPSARSGHAAVWTGSQMIVFGGSSSAARGTGGRYDPVTDTWSAMSTVGAPTIGVSHAVWTGTRMLVSGGGLSAAYDPVADTWSPLPAPPLVVEESGHVWTGAEWLIFGWTHRDRTDVLRYVP